MLHVPIYQRKLDQQEQELQYGDFLRENGVKVANAKKLRLIEIKKVSCVIWKFALSDWIVSQITEKKAQISSNVNAIIQVIAEQIICSLDPRLMFCKTCRKLELTRQIKTGRWRR